MTHDDDDRVREFEIVSPEDLIPSVPVYGRPGAPVTHAEGEDDGPGEDDSSGAQHEEASDDGASDTSDETDESAADGARENKAAASASSSSGSGESRYDPLKAYDARREFEAIMVERAAVHDGLNGFTDPFVDSLKRIMWVAAGAMIYTTAVMPFLEWVNYFGIPMHGWLRVGLIAIIPLLTFMALQTWRFSALRVRMRWMHFHLHQYIEDEIAHAFANDNARYTGKIASHDKDGRMAMLNLWRLRLRSYICWHRISIHGFLIQGGLRPALFQKFITPRLFVFMTPVVTVAIFLFFQMGVALTNRANGLTGDDSALTAVLSHLWSVLMDDTIDLGGFGGVGPVSLPVFLFFLVGYGCAVATFRVARSIMLHILTEVEKVVSADDKLNAWINDCAQAVLDRHAYLLNYYNTNKHRRGKYED